MTSNGLLIVLVEITGNLHCDYFMKVFNVLMTFVKNTSISFLMIKQKYLLRRPI